MLCEDGGRDWSDVCASEGMARNAGPHQKLDDKRGTDSLSKEINPANTLILDFWPPHYLRKNFYCFKTPSLKYFVITTLGNYHII